MATPSPSPQKVARDLDNCVKCAICWDFYDDPRFLPCSHTFCYACIKNLCTTGFGECPMRDNTTINGAKINQLPVNRVAKDLVEYIRNSSQPKSLSKIKCDHCKTILSEFICETCEKRYCTTCLKLKHDINQFKTHKIDITIEKGSANVCQQHIGEIQKYWCNKCQTTVCSDCLLFQHKNHSFIGVEGVSQIVNAQYHSSSQKLSLSQKNLEKFNENVTEANQTCYGACAKAKHLIEQTINQLQHLLEERKEYLINKLTKNYADQQYIFRSKKHDIEEQLKSVLIRALFTKQLINKNDTFQLINMRTDVINYNALIEEQCKQLMCGFVFDVQDASIDSSVSNLKDVFDYLGTLSIETFLITNRNTRPLLKLSALEGEEKYQEFEGNYAYGYRFHLNAPLTCNALMLKVALFNQTLTVFLVDNNDFVIKKEIFKVSDSDSKILRWITIPLAFQLQHNYYMFIWTCPIERYLPSIACRESNQCLRQINKNVSVRSKRAKIDRSMCINIQSKIDVVYDAFLSKNGQDQLVPAIEMILDI